MKGLSLGLHLYRNRRRWTTPPAAPCISIGERDEAAVLVVDEGVPTDPFAIDTAARFAFALAPADGDPEGKALLGRLGRWREVDPSIFDAGSLGHAIRERRTEGLAVERGGATARVAAHRLVRMSADARGFTAQHAQLIVVARRAGDEEELLAAAADRLDFVLGFAFDRERFRELLERGALEDDEDGLMLLLRPPVPPPPEGSFAAWVLSSLRAEAAPEDGVVARVGDAPSHELAWVGGPIPDVRATLMCQYRQTVVKNEELRSVLEQEVFSGSLLPKDFVQPVPGPALAPLLREACSAWRAALAAAFERALARFGDAVPMPMDYAGEIPPLHGLVALWLEEGPPGPRSPRLSIDDGRLEQLVPTVRCEVTRDHERDIATIRVGEWLVRLVRRCDEWNVELAAGDAEPVSIADNDPHSGPEIFAPAGDAAAFRDFCQALAELVRRAEEDRELPPPRVVDGGEDFFAEDEEPPQSLPITEALRFGDRTRHPPLLDRRLELDFAVGEPPHEIAQRLREDPEGRERWQRSADRYAACIRELFDPTFELPNIPW